jgi:chorismate mutase
MSNRWQISPVAAGWKNDGLFQIAGPCSAESREQVVETAQQLVGSGRIDMFRCGVWKPRSSPNSFQGRGEEALAWLGEVEKTLGIPVCTEVATPKHLEEAMKANISCFWIGARTSINPFIVQQIADAARGTDIGMMIKNPLTADLKLWYGNFERFAQAGIYRLAGIYRGFSSTYPHRYRNDPAWQMLIEFKRRHQEIPVFFDPSHLSGQAKYIPELMQKALFLCVNGFMTEVHHCPQAALCDREQQLSVHEYVKILNGLQIPQIHSDGSHILQRQREVIDHIDSQILELLLQRFLAVGEIAALKKEYNLPIFQVNRWKKMKSQALLFAQTRNLNREFICQFMELLHEYSILEQESIIKNNTT